jgi:hypothetical protein
MIGKNRIMIYGPKEDGTYVVEFRTSEGDVLAISIPRGEAGVIRHFQERMPYGLSVLDDRSAGTVAPALMLPASMALRSGGRNRPRVGHLV